MTRCLLLESKLPKFILVGAVRDILGQILPKLHNLAQILNILYSFDLRWMPRLESLRASVIAKSKMAAIQILGMPYSGYPKGCDHVICVIVMANLATYDVILFK